MGLGWWGESPILVIVALTGTRAQVVVLLLEWRRVVLVVARWDYAVATRFVCVAAVVTLLQRWRHLLCGRAT